jgi:hypothetical protein
MAKKHYWAYTSALSSLSQAASTAIYGNEYEQATKSAASAYSAASSQAARSGFEASATLSSAAAAASNSAVRAFDESQDYVYSAYNSTYHITLLTCVSLRHLG